ncbi:hypothetical protein ACFVYA_40900 [Amycolatopsis sp. NPDC058278]|uniref:hypothetical protein n=1 Tax=Amycolatopsis sp. NPDC058278 TaxID=3346417 RepID=UPI0036DC20FD
MDEWSWLVRERATGMEWRVAMSGMAWEAGGYDPGRFEVYVADTPIGVDPEDSSEPKRTSG